MTLATAHGKLLDVASGLDCVSHVGRCFWTGLLDVATLLFLLDRDEKEWVALLQNNLPLPLGRSNFLKDLLDAASSWTKAVNMYGACREFVWCNV